MLNNAHKIPKSDMIGDGVQFPCDSNNAAFSRNPTGTLLDKSTVAFQMQTERSMTVNTRRYVQTELDINKISE